MITEKYKVWFFAGGETRDDKFNVFTGSFIRLMKTIFGTDFDFIRGVYHNTPMLNVIWALNNAQKPATSKAGRKKPVTAFRQIVAEKPDPDTQIIITSSSSGSVVAAQTACYLAEENKDKQFFRKPFHLVLGASMISPESDLYKKLLRNQEEGRIGIILNDEMQDDGDTSYGVGGKTRAQAYKNAFLLIFPGFSEKFKGPSFLNTNPVTGHIHRRRSQTILKAYDYINLILIRHNLCGEHYREIAKKTLENQSINSLTHI